jgi:ubiquinone/menaquinone biosynthesis C-methylase UbiE
MQSTTQNSALKTPFDAMAADYDASFTRSLIGERMRHAVWQRLDSHFHQGDSVLELGCGTGEDAIYLAQRGVQVLATDVSEGMLTVARAKAAAAGLDHLITVKQMPIEALAHPLAHPPAHPLNGLLSNFGALNCVENLPTIAAGMARLLQPGGVALLCVMGPLVPWEWAWYFGRGQSRKALRRLRAGGTPWRGLTIRYPSISAVQRAFRPYFHTRRVAAIGAFVPPSYVESWAKTHPATIHALDRLERRFETTWPLPWLADHYFIELQSR